MAKSIRMHKPKLIESGNETNGWFVWLMLLMVALIFVRTVFELNIPVAIFLVISLIPALMGNQSQILAFSVCCIPFSSAFQYKYAILLCIVCYVVRSRGKAHVNRVMITVLIMMLWEVFHAFYDKFSFVEYLRGFAELLLLAVAVSMDTDRLDYKLIIRSLAYTTVAICMIIFIVQAKNTGWTLGFLVRNFRFGGGNAAMLNFGLTFNPNQLGSICNYALTGLMILFNRREHMLLDIISAVLLVVFGMLTMSRTFVVCLAVIVLCFILMSRGTTKKKLKMIGGVILAGAITLILLKALLPQVAEMFVNRFTTGDITGSRDILFTFYNKHIWSSFMYFVFGIGMQNISGKIERIYDGFFSVCHNGFQEVWVLWGIVGVILFIYLLVAMVRAARKNRKGGEAIQYLPFILMLISTMTGQLLTAEHVLLSLTFVFVCLCIKPKTALCSEAASDEGV